LFGLAILKGLVLTTSRARPVIVKSIGLALTGRPCVHSSIIPQYGNNGSFYRFSVLLYDLKHLIGWPMRYSKEHKQETHERIVKRAAVRLREKGAHGVGVADLMKEAGLTHGGFYAHFDSREALVIETIAHIMDRGTERWRKLGEQTPPEKRLATIVDSYLSAGHRDDPGHGCAVPTLGAEIARESPKARKAFAAKLEQMIDMLASLLPDVSPKAARKQAIATLGTMMGTVVMARIAGNGEFSDEILAAGREAVLDREASTKNPAKKSAGKKAATTLRH
jgi:TetR/AcrR family transcriptional regulator, transcriptional repressor for nem operon